METYFVKEKAPNEFLIGKFEDSRYPTGVYTVTKKRYFSCNCPGFYRQHDKTQHKHCLLIKFWQEKLESASGFMFWFNEGDIEYRRVFD